MASAAVFRARTLGVLRTSSRYFRSSAPRRLDFNALSEKIGTQDARAELDALRRAHSDVITKAGTVGTLKPIDWAYFQKAIQRPGLVDSFKKASETLAPQVLDNPFVSELDQNFAALMKEAEQAQVFSENQIKELEKQLNELRTAGDVRNMTIKEEAAKHPELVAEIEAEMKQHKWF